MASEDKKYVFLKALNSDLIKYIEPLFLSNHIPIIKLKNDSGDIMEIIMGFSTSNIDVYVPSRFLAQAQELLDFMESGTDIENIESDAVYNSNEL